MFIFAQVDFKLFQQTGNNHTGGVKVYGDFLMRGMQFIPIILAGTVLATGAIDTALASERYAGNWEMVGSIFDFPVVEDGKEITIPYRSKLGHGVGKVPSSVRP